MKQFVRGLNLPPDLVEPFVWNMTIGTSGPDARPISEMDGLLQSFVNVIPHFVTGDADRSVFATSIAQLKPPQKITPPIPPAMSNVPSEKRELGLQRKVQIREISPFRASLRQHRSCFFCPLDPGGHCAKAPRPHACYQLAASPKETICAV